MSTPQIDPTILETYATLRLTSVKRLDQIDLTTINDSKRSFTREFAWWSHSSVVHASERGLDVSKKWLARCVLACRYAAGYQSQDGNTENDATRALTPLCLPDITINIAHLFAGGNPPLWFVRSSDTARRSIASAHSTAASIYMHLYLMPVESRPQHIQQCSLSCYATHIIKFLVDAVIHANNAVLFSWRLFSPTMITVALAHRELMREIRKSGYWVPPDNYAWLGLLDTVLTGWEEHRREFPFDPRTLFGQLLPDCLFERRGDEKRIRLEVYGLYTTGSQQAGQPV